MCIKIDPKLIQNPWKLSYQKKGELTILEKDSWPIDAKRIFFIQNVRKLAVRGNHAHKTTYQFIFPLAGAIDLNIDSPNGGWTFSLDSSGNEGVVVPPMNWLWLRILRPKTIVAVLCNEPYNEDEYIRDQGKYEHSIQQLGSSASGTTN